MVAARLEQKLSSVIMYVDAMEIKYQNFWAAVKKLQTEAQLIGRLDTSNKTKYKKKYEAGEITAREIAGLSHQRGLHYELTVLKEDELFCYLVIKGGHIKVNFLDANLRIYLAYYFSPSTKYTDKVFLDEIWYNNYTSESNDTESYRLHFVFDEDGNVNYRKYDEVNQKTEDFKNKEQSDVSGLYESYPLFEKYEDLIRLERNFPLEIMKM